MEELVIIETNNFENYISQLDNNDICFQTINEEINDVDKMNIFLTEYEKNIDSDKDQKLKFNKLKKMIKFVLSYSKLEYVKYLVEKYELIEFRSFDLNYVVKNSNQDVLEYYLKIVKQLEPSDIIDSFILSDNISLNSLKLLLIKSNLMMNDYFMLLRVFGTKNDLECFEYIIHQSKDHLDLTQKFIAREEPLTKYMNYRDYSVPVECDLLLFVSDSNSFKIVKYLLGLKIFSSTSITNAFEYVNSNQKFIRFRGNEIVDNKIDVLHLLFDAMKDIYFKKN
jgi:hypothetical protein